MRQNFLDPESLLIANRVLNWAKDYLATDHENIQRPYNSGVGVCPFITNSINNNYFYMAFEPDVLGRSETQIKEIMMEYMDEFTLELYVAPSEYTKKTLLVIFPNIPDKRTGILDEVHKQIKTVFVKKGLMIGQFHKNCPDVSVHNSGFRVSISEIPLIAIRHMAFHDIIFLEENEDPTWFEAYNSRFGDYYKDSKSEENMKHFQKIYRKLKKKYFGK